MSIRTRFAPSPTGFLHIGGVRTALFNWLLPGTTAASSSCGSTTPIRNATSTTPSSASSTGFAGSASTGTKGRKRAGRSGPYYQSQRTESYRRAADQLLASGHVYRDYSTDSERTADKARGRARQAGLSISPQGTHRRGSRPVRSREDVRSPSLRGPAGTNARPPRPDQGRRRVRHR